MKEKDREGHRMRGEMCKRERMRENEKRWREKEKLIIKNVS